MIDYLLLLFDNFSAPFLFLLVFFVEAGIPIPVPYDILILVAGFRHVNFILIALAVVSGNLAGSTILYLISLKFGHPVLHRSVKLLGISEKRMDIIKRLFEHWGGLAIVFARLVPGLRFVATLFSGMFSLPYFRVFLPNLFLGSVLWVSIYWILGAVFGSSMRLMIHVLGFWSALLTIALIIFIIMIIFCLFKNTRLKRNTKKKKNL